MYISRDCTGETVDPRDALLAWDMITVTLGATRVLHHLKLQTAFSHQIKVYINDGTVQQVSCVRYEARDVFQAL